MKVLHVAFQCKATYAITTLSPLTCGKSIPHVNRMCNLDFLSQKDFRQEALNVHLANFSSGGFPLWGLRTQVVFSGAFTGRVFSQKGVRGDPFKRIKRV